MEKVPGIELERVWHSMDIRGKWAVVQNLMRYQATWSSISFTKYGSLYYARDLDKPSENGHLYTDANGVDITDSKFAIGPSVGRDWMDDQRSTIDIDRGPCKIISIPAIYLLEMTSYRDNCRRFSNRSRLPRVSCHQSAPSAQITDIALRARNISTN